MKSIIKSLLALVVLLLGAVETSVSAQSIDEATSQNWELVQNWPRLPAGLEISQVSGVTIDNFGNVFVLHRTEKIDRTMAQVITTVTVLKLDSKTGDLLDSWGADHFVRPHGITVDGENNVWLTDTNLHQTFKFSNYSRPLLSIGEKATLGNDATHFGAPSDIAVATDGSFYVSDGYDNSRVAYFSADGTFVKEWGTKGTKLGQFVVPHGIALDSRGQIYVADRENQRLQVFDESGGLIDVWPKSGKIGRITDVVITPNDYIYVAIGGESDQPGVRILSPKLHEVGRIVAGPDVVAHQLAVSKDNTIYLADLRSGRILKYALC